MGFLLLDLHARADGFVAGDAFGALGERLSAAGHRVSTERLVARDGEGAGEFAGRVRGCVRGAGAEVVVLSRAWERGLVEAVREGAPSAKVVRVTQGVRAALDEAFDHVLDPTGVLALAEGESAPREAAYQRTTAAELRRRLAVVGAETGAVVTGGRPSISGPSSGCPFLLDARKSEVFAGLDMDPEEIQTKGCTFCLDNSGAYVVPEEGAVVGAWISGLRRIRESRPDVREVLLTDERPHPFLPAFFEAVEREGLGPVELLWKSRVDWLLEYAEAVERACQIAARSGSVAHLYLMGFESFDRGHLALFNKGHGPELSEEAIAKMRELQERYPASFEHRRYRSHGIVLFTPWTEPESLIENARWMRRLRFHELRSEAVKTRLRLYPRVPLHALAERDGLLTEAFEEGRGDRAAEQGYDASVPWRFKDGRTEAVFQLANALHATDRGIADADLIETAARFVMRWPGLSKEPGLASLPVRAAVEAWGAPLAFLLHELGPAAAAFDPEVEGIGKTGKRAALKESVRGADAEEMARAYRAMGFAAEVVLRHTMEKGSGAHAAGDDHAIVAVAEDERALGEVLSAQRALGQTEDRAAQGAAVRAMGALMGYPECCVEAFAELPDRGDNLENERLPFLRRPGEALSPWLHRTGVVRLVAHHVCSPGCAESVARAERLVELLGAADAEGPGRLLAAMSVPSLFVDYERFAAVEGAWAGEWFRVERVVAVGRCRDFEATLARAKWVKPVEEAIVVGFRDSAERAIPASRPLLAEPGRAIRDVALRALKSSESKAEERRQGGGAKMPVVPAALRRGTPVGHFVVGSVEKTDSSAKIKLVRGRETVEVVLRTHVEGRGYTVRKGPWAVDVAGAENLGNEARVAIGMLVRALPV